jgi:hypothetical protein
MCGGNVKIGTQIDPIDEWEIEKNRRIEKLKK